MKKLAFIDLDDTLLGPQKEISPENLEAVADLRSHGYEVVIASGRHHRNILQFDDRLTLDGWIISSHGAVVRHAKSEKVLHELNLAPEEAGQALAFGRQHDVNMMVYHRSGVFAQEESEWSRLYTQRAGWKPQVTDLRPLGEDGVEKFMFTGHQRRIDELEEHVRHTFAARNYVVRSENEIVEILSPLANKSIGTAAVAQRLQVPPSDVLAFGDSYNDVEMLAWAGLSVAMRHGRPAAHAAADFISPEGAAESALARAVRLALDAHALA